MKHKNKIVSLGIAALFAMVWIMAASAQPAENVVWLKPEDSNAPYCHTVEVEVWANVTDERGCAGGTINLSYDPECANVTNWEINTTNWLPPPNSTWDTSVDGREWIAFMTLSPKNGTFQIGTLTIHCCNSTSFCTTPLIFNAGSPLLSTPPALPIDVEWKNGTFSCGEKPDLEVTDTWPDNCTICYNVTNTGNGTASAGHNTMLYVDGLEVEYDPVPVVLVPGDSHIGCFNYVWTYTPLSDNITVCADFNNTVDESNETNNCLTNTWKCGDVNMNGNVDFLGDAIGVARHYMYGDPIKCRWAGDVDCSGNIDFLGDAIKIARHYMYKEALDCCCCWEK